jgi:predicted Zn-dependent protease
VPVRAAGTAERHPQQPGRLIHRFHVLARYPQLISSLKSPLNYDLTAAHNLGHVVEVDDLIAWTEDLQLK